jgi:hypothetical protein
VDITHRTDTSDLYGGSTVPSNTGAPGTIRWTTTVTWTQDGQSHSVTQTGSASGKYNIASAEVCSSFDGGFETC